MSAPVQCSNRFVALDPEPTSHRRRAPQAIALGLLFAAGVINFFDRASLSVANNTIRAEMHLSGTEMGWLLSAFSLAYGIAQLPLVELISRFGTRSTLGTGLGLWSAAQALTAFVRGLPSFLTLRVLLGAGESPFYPCGVQIVRDWFSAKTRGRATGLMSSSQTFTLAIAPPVLALLILRIGWRAMFLGLGLAGVVVTAAWFALYREPATHAGRVEPAHRAPWSRFLRSRAVWGMMLGWGGINYTVWLYLAWIPGYLQTARHLSLARTGLLAAIPFLAGAFGMLLSGMVADWLAHRGVALTRIHLTNLVGGMVISAISTFAVSRSASTAAAIAGISFAIFFIHFAGTSGWGYAQIIGGPLHSASLGALQNFASFIIASAAPVVTGWLLDRTRSFTLALALCSAVTLLGALSYATLARPQPNRVL